PSARRRTSTLSPCALCLTTKTSTTPTRRSVTTGVSASGLTEQRLEPRAQGARPERLRDEVVGAVLEDLHLTLLVALGRQHQHRQLGGAVSRPDVAQHLVAVQAWQVEVKHERIRCVAI